MPATKLQALIASQSRDDQRRRIRPQAHMRNATDLGTAANPKAGWEVLAQAPDTRSRPSVLVGISKTWGPAEAAYDPAVHVCPACGDRIRRGPTVGLHYCLVCSASSDDPRRWPHQYDPQTRRGRATRSGRVLRGGTGRVA